MRTRAIKTVLLVNPLQHDQVEVLRRTLLALEGVTDVRAVAGANRVTVLHAVGTPQPYELAKAAEGAGILASVQPGKG